MMKIALILILVFIKCFEGTPLEGDTNTKNEREFDELKNDSVKPEDVMDDTEVEMTESYSKKKIEKGQIKTCNKIFTDIDDGIYSSNTIVGGSGGGRLYINRGGEKRGRIVRSMKFLKYKNELLQRIEVDMSDGSHQTCGHRGNSHTSESETLYLGTHELITKLKLWTNNECAGEGHITGIMIRTNKGKLFEFYADRKGEPYEPPLGSGVLIGFQAQCGVSIHGLGPLFLQKVGSSTISNIIYPDIRRLIINSKPIHINTVSYDNKKGSTEQEYILTGSKVVQETASWSLTSSLEAMFSQEVKVTAGSFYFQVSWGSKFSIKRGMSYTHARNISTTNTRSYSFILMVPAYEAVAATAITYEGVIKTCYIGTQTFSLVTGRRFSYTIHGMYNGIASTQVIVSTKNI